MLNHFDDQGNVANKRSGVQRKQENLNRTSSIKTDTE